MRSGDRRLGRRHALGAAALGLGLSQPGHVLAYLAHYGWPGVTQSVQGVHSYLPALLHLSAGGLGALILLAVLVVGAGRLALGRALGRGSEPGLPLLHLFVISAVVQLDAYMTQETAETLLAGSPLDSGPVVSMFAWGAVGQLPLALLGAFALRWLWARVRRTADAVRCELEVAAPLPIAAVSIAVRPPAPDRESFLNRVVLAALWTRGPPPTGRLASSRE
jgi:hypothetical protein